MLFLHVVYSTVHSREIMDSLITAKFCRCILIPSNDRVMTATALSFGENSIDPGLTANVKLKELIRLLLCLPLCLYRLGTYQNNTNLKMVTAII